MTTEDPRGGADGDPDTADDDLLDRLDRGEPAATPEEQARRAPYERLLAQVRTKPVVEAPAGMRARVRAGWQADRQPVRPRRRTGMWVASGGALMAAAVLLFLLLRGDPAGALGVQVEFETPGATRGADPAVGSILHVRATGGPAHVEIRVYRETKLVVQCPGAETCHGLDLALRIAAPGTYHIVAVSSAKAIPPPHADGFDKDALITRAAGAKFEIRESQYVRP